jgi:hypothetical protein|tara:strand:+ start:84 stop:566 length:483 start_codon:yes stop_codon:yes gene_type:complete
MKARIVNGKIVKYPKLPSSFGNVVVGFDRLPSSEHEKVGFYDIVTPEYNKQEQVIHNLHTIDNYEDAEGNTKTVFTYDVKNRTFEKTLAKMKAEKIEQLKANANRDLQVTDWYVTRKAEKGTAIPGDIETQRDQIRSSVNTKESEINALTKKIDVYKYSI